jgi:hypothetical protein
MGGDSMKSKTKGVFMAEPEKRGSTTLNTTLYDLVWVISEEVEPGEEKLVDDVVLHLLDKGQIRFRGDVESFRYERCLTATNS